MLNRSFLISLVSVFSFFVQASPSQSGLSGEEVVTLDTRPGVKQSFLLLKPHGEVKGVVVMFPGHEGIVHFVKGKTGDEVTHEGGGLTTKKEKTGEKPGSETYYFP